MLTDTPISFRELKLWAVIWFMTAAAGGGRHGAGPETCEQAARTTRRDGDLCQQVSRGWTDDMKQ